MKKTNKRILILCTSLEIGKGPEKVAVTLGNSLINKGYSVKYLVFYDINPKNEIHGDYYSLQEKYYPKQEESKIESFLRKSFRFILSLSIISPINISNFCKVNQIDTVISFKEDCSYSLLISKLLMKKKTKIIITKQDHYLYKENFLEFFIYNLLLYHLLYLNADLVISVSKGIYQTILNNNILHKKMIYAYNSHDIQNYVTLSKELLDESYNFLFQNNFIFITIGSLIPIKGHYFLIRAFKILMNSVNNTRLLIFGEGYLRNYLQNMIKKLELENNVYFIERQKNIFKFLNQSHCFVFSSLLEGLPNVLIEALSVNLPIISTDCVSGPREILCPELKLNEKIEYPYFGKYGILSKIFNFDKVSFFSNSIEFSSEEQMFAFLMKSVLFNKDLREKYSFGVNRAKNFSIETIIPKWEEIL